MPAAWTWSSYAGLLGQQEPVPGIVDHRRTVALFGHGRHALEAIRHFVESDFFTSS
jgi:hypothetical protein